MSVFRVGEAPGTLLRVAVAPYARVLEARIAGGLVACPRQGAIDATSCDDCPWSKGRSPDGQYRLCLAIGSDSVAAWMRPACRIVSTTPATQCADAEEQARAVGSHELLVLDRDRVLIGVVCRCDFKRQPGGTVGDCMPEDVYVTGPATPLAEAFAVMHALAISCLPVVEGALVVGIITGAELVRADVPGAAERWRRDCQHGLGPM